MELSEYPEREALALQKIAATEGIGASAVKYILEHGARICADPLMSSRTGAQWRVDGNIYLPDVTWGSLDCLAGIVHEAKHLEQGSALARSVLGELGGWQAEFSFREQYSGKAYPPEAPLGRLLRYSVTEIAEQRDASRLRRARADMLEAFPNYVFIYLYPLFPSSGFARIVDWMSPRILDPLQHAITRREIQK